MVWGEKLVRKLLAGKRQIQMKIQILALVHRLDNGVKGGKSGKILAGKATKAAELVNLVGPWAANNPPHCKHKTFVCKRVGAQNSGKVNIIK